MTWWPARVRLAILAVAAAVLTGAWAVLVGGTGLSYGAVAYVLVAAAAAFLPAAIAVQVIGGQILAAGVLSAPSGAVVLLALPVVLGVVVSAELLAVVARLDLPTPRAPDGALRRAGFAATIGVGVYTAVSLAGALPGPAGPVATLVAAGGIVAVALLLVRDVSTAKP